MKNIKFNFFQQNKGQRSEQQALSLSDNCNMINVSSKKLKTSHHDYSSSSTQNSILLSRDQKPRCESPSTDSRISSIDLSSDCYESMTEENYSSPEDSQSLQSIEDPHEEKENKASKCTRRKPYSMKDGAVKGRASYERRRKKENKETERMNEIKELKKTFDKNNEILEKRNQLLQDYIEELKSSKNKD